MNCKTYKINDSVTLAHIRTDKFKKSRLTVAFITPTDRERTPQNSMLMSTAFFGTEKYPDFRSVCRRAEELYAADISDFNIMRGNLQILGIGATMLGDDYITSDDRHNGFSILDGVFGLVSELICRPLYRAEDVETEKVNRINRIKSRKNDAFGYAKYRFTRIMFENEPGGLPLIGEIPQVEAVTPEILTERSRKLYTNAPIEIFYCGTADAETVISQINKYFPDVAASAVKAIPSDSPKSASNPRNIEESGEYRQGNMLMGFRTGVCIKDPQFYATELMNQIFGDGPSSKLFLNVREKKSLCYFCASSYDEEQGVIIVGCGINNEDYQNAQTEILLQLEEIKKGNISDTELEAARAAIESDCREAEDHPSDYEDFGRTERLFGGPATIEEYRQGIITVTKDEIVDAARRVTLDTVYFLRGTLAGGEDDE